ncbi:MAG TPA: SpoIIE family protein phosphatase [Pseudonocardiaceae bacterium]|nr:SpoIIE family protein phosphatase [Pseudonocardiaceae bacterium]
MIPRDPVPGDPVAGSAGASDPLFTGGGQLGQVMAGWDWAATPLGPSQSWPASLRSVVRILLTSRFSMWMGWGPELTFFYNDAYWSDTLRAKHPWALGRPAREVWAEIWEDIGPRLESVVNSGVATWDEDLLLFLERSGYPEETYHTFSYSPLLGADAENATVAGILCVVTEGTDRVLGERRMATLRDLGLELAASHAADDVCAAVREQIGRNGRDLPFTLTYLFESDERARLAVTTGITGGHPAAPELIDLAGQEVVWPVCELLAGDTVVIDDLARRFGRLPTGDWPQPPTRAVGVPLARRGQARPAGFFIAALNPYRPFDDRYRGFVDLLAGQIAAGLASADAYEAEHQRAAALAELDRAKTEFFSNVSHEFRTPLTLIAGPAQDSLADEAEPLPPGQRGRMEIIHRNVGRLRRLVNDLLDVARIEGGRLVAETVAVDLAGLTRDIATSFAPAVARAGLRFDIDCPPLARNTHVDPGQWEKIVLNLLSNAVKFTLAGRIRLSLRGGPELVELTVEDTGVGIAPDELPLVFQRFHRVSGTVSRSHEGTGIGLALVHELARLHGGEVSVRSALGSGSTFTVRIPYGTSATSVTAARRDSLVGVYLEEALQWGADTGVASSPPVRGPAAATVLVVDDNPDLRRYIAGLLAPFWRVVVVGDGKAALAAIRDEAPDLVLTDVMMPNLDGFGLLRALREDPETATIPVVFLSARAGEESAIEGLDAGADDYLVKPFSAAELLARVRANLELAGLRNHEAAWRKALLESLRDAVVVTDSAGTVLDANAAFESILGFERAIRYQPPYPWWPDPVSDPEEFRHAEELMAALLRGEESRFLGPYRHRDGHRVYLEGWVTSVFDGDQRRLVGIFRDVTAELAAIARQRALASFGMRLAEASDVHQVCEAGLAELGAVFGARSVLLATEQAGQLSVSDGSWESLEEVVRSALLALREDRRCLVELPWVVDLPGAPASRPGVPRLRGICAAVPSAGTFRGIWLDLDPPREFSTEDRALLILLCGYFGQALERAQLFDEQRTVASALQQSILGPTETPGNVAVRYVPSVAPLEVGGDWYDVVPLPGARLGLVVGDCVGQGLGAATVMGQLRSACRALLLELPGPREVLNALDRFAARIPGARCTTVFCAVVATTDGTLRFCSAGHVPGIVTHPDGQLEILDGARSVPLAVLDEAHRSEAETVLRPGSTLLLCTDGLFERRRESLDVGLARLRSALTAAGAYSEQRLADHLLDRQLADGHHDDVALVLYRQPNPAPAPFTATVPAEASQLAALRRSLASWLTAAGVDSSTAATILIASGEACANAIEHACQFDPSRTFQITAACRDGTIEVVVRDTGQWIPFRPAPHNPRGRGIQIMNGLMDTVTIERTEGGTAVRLTKRLT